ncbi:MAG: hypothetical protein ACI9FB_004487, partial [Candidatus Azotimanducaceae bacterium]
MKFEQKVQLDSLTLLTLFILADNLKMSWMFFLVVNIVV